MPIQADAQDESDIPFLLLLYLLLCKVSDTYELILREMRQTL